MKKLICLMSAVLLLLSVGTACSKKTDSGSYKGLQREYEGETHTTTEPKYTVGREAHSQKVKLSGRDYEIYYYDENRNAAKIEYYMDDVLSYYHAVSAADENGNALQEKYYGADGKLFATVDDGAFFDENGKEISEDMMDYLLNQHKSA